MGKNRIPNNTVRISIYRKRLLELKEKVEDCKRSKGSATTGISRLIYEEDQEFYEEKIVKLRATINKLLKCKK